METPKEYLIAFKREYRKALRENKTSFFFRYQEFDINYAKYVVEYYTDLHKR